MRLNSKLASAALSIATWSLCRCRHFLRTNLDQSIQDACLAPCMSYCSVEVLETRPGLQPRCGRSDPPTSAARSPLVHPRANPAMQSSTPCMQLRSCTSLRLKTPLAIRCPTPSRHLESFVLKFSHSAFQPDDPARELQHNGSQHLVARKASGAHAQVFTAIGKAAFAPRSRNASEQP